jgi:hypothetical protein
LWHVWEKVTGRGGSNNVPSDFPSQHVLSRICTIKWDAHLCTAAVKALKVFVVQRIFDLFVVETLEPLALNFWNF